MKLMPWWMRVVRRLVRELDDERTHNEYLARKNADLTAENTQRSISEESLRMRVSDLNGMLQKARSAQQTRND